MAVFPGSGAAQEDGTTKKAPTTAERPAKRAEPKPAARPSSPDAAADVSKERLTIEYQGVLQDEAQRPISGVFPLEFKLFRSRAAVDSVWREVHFVGVVDGQYTVPLGQETPLFAQHLEGVLWVGVELRGEGEILRDRLVFEPGRHPTGANAMAGSPSTVAHGSAGRSSAFADVAERAVLADRARIADTAEALGDLKIEDIERLSNLALERLGEHISDPDAHNASGRSGRGSVGTERRVMDLAGGRGGQPYDVRCPPGFVVTGIEGRAGRVLDSIQIVCSPLQ